MNGIMTDEVTPVVIAIMSTFAHFLRTITLIMTSILEQLKLKYV